MFNVVLPADSLSIVVSTHPGSSVLKGICVCWEHRTLFGFSVGAVGYSDGVLGMDNGQF